MDGGSGHCIGDRDQDHPQGNAKKAKWLCEEALQIPVKRSEKQRRKGKIFPFECRVPKNSTER